MSNIPLSYYNDTPPKHVTVHSYHQRYQILNNLGNGSFGTVELARIKFPKEELLTTHMHKSGTLLYPLDDSKRNQSNLVAIKTMKKKLPSLHDYAKVKEIKFISSVPSHPNLVQIFEIFIDDLDHQLHITMEALNQNLYQLIKSRKGTKFSSMTLRSILTQLLHAIEHIHHHQYFHRDVKPENILVIPTAQYYGSKGSIPSYRRHDNFVVKLGDYGLARHVNNMRPYTGYVSTRWYRSPEILLRQNRYGCEIDIWAYGTVAAEIVNFAPLFPGANEIDMLCRINQTLGSPSLPVKVDQEYCVPVGGYWPQAAVLGHALGHQLPFDRGFTRAQILPDAGRELCDTIMSCLQWDPISRPTAQELACFEYFSKQ
ncbi:IME2 [Candida metapsilosis]|uniref:IME2 n=1 Tax=Candida metapsilosis TaxID=273372 RepID=A0A8H7ZFE5_9ASCO|nr:IME2 [Candida metapsilosis]